MSNLTIVHANKLLEGSYSLPIDELRVINLALTKIDSRKPNIGEIRIDVTEFIKTYGLQSRNNVYASLRAAVKSIMRSPIKIPIGDEIEEVAWLDKNRYHRDDGHHVIIQFSREVEPFLFDLKKAFTSVVHCRTGSLEIAASTALASATVHCRTGSLEKS